MLRAIFDGSHLALDGLEVEGRVVHVPDLLGLVELQQRLDGRRPLGPGDAVPMREPSLVRLRRQPLGDRGVTREEARHPLRARDKVTDIVPELGRQLHDDARKEHHLDRARVLGAVEERLDEIGLDIGRKDVRATRERRGRRHAIRETARRADRDSESLRELTQRELVRLGSEGRQEHTATVRELLTSRDPEGGWDRGAFGGVDLSNACARDSAERGGGESICKESNARLATLQFSAVRHVTW